jgi:hypothetical protein
VLKNVFKQGVVLYAYNPGTGEEGWGRRIKNSWPAWAT